MKNSTYFVLATLVLLSTSGFAQKLKVTKADVFEGGMHTEAEYDLGTSPWCDAKNVRWLQNVQLCDKDGKIRNDVPGFPSGDFIDPQPGGTFDNEPWYDFTYNSDADRQVPKDHQGGKGPYFRDIPKGWAPFGEITFKAKLIVVCIDETKNEFQYMGGFGWGFKVAADKKTTTKNGLANCPDSAELRKSFNDALGRSPASFKKWKMVESDPRCRLQLVVPEPTTMIALAAGVASLVRRRKAA